jgi:hypothetical protein
MAAEPVKLKVNEAARMRTALLLVIIGLVVESFCIHDITPGTFILFAVVSVPLVAIGIGIFVATVWRVLRETRGL